LPIWNADSQYVTFQSDRDGDSGIFRQAAAGGPAERLVKGDQGIQWEPETWSPDGKVLALGRREPSEEGTWTLSKGELAPKSLIHIPNSRQAHAAFSPDGRWLAYTSTELAGKSLPSPTAAQIFVQPYPPTGAKYQVSTEGGRVPRWSQDGKQIFYQKPLTNRLFAVEIRTQPTFTIEKTTSLPIEGIIQPDAPGPRNYDITPDGKFIVVLPASASQPNANRRPPSQIDFVVNWFTELQQRVPVK
jgi:Tol biopolymer transport system component